ncbi:cupin domain-containing protein [Massilia sp. Dwa41.01b]|uniref:cupin domain-containing protein n=1 Tax=unclassified Massilia TaxID=2609279 RepID=UPI0015FF24C3|nr:MULTISPECIES: cupin domain-containing protein [unclassified Massilia]QNA87892.1 cupin domain-containing protein [Massilia sp. Dwa41.01b]QNA98796.1 cupin domain-containing protein [Massilia sp. Se16.2.3]
MPLDLRETYVHLSEDGSARALDGNGFWQLPEPESARYDKGWLITEFAFTEDWPTWEMHPEGDEFVYLLSGAVELLLERDGTVETVTLEGSAAALVPRGVWHTAKVRSPSRMLHVTRGADTQHRPA